MLHDTLTSIPLAFPHFAVLLQMPQKAQFHLCLLKIQTHKFCLSITPANY